MLNLWWHVTGQTLRYYWHDWGWLYAVVLVLVFFLIYGACNSLIEYGETRALDRLAEGSPPPVKPLSAG